MFARFDVSMLVPGLPCDGYSLLRGSLGGSESAGIYMAKALSRLGARVRVFCNTGAPSVDTEGVAYAPIHEWTAFAGSTPHDVCIVQRAHDAFARRTNARLNVLWCHDLAMGRQKNSFTAALWNIDRVVVLSDYMKRQYQEVYALDPDVLLSSRNGIDLALFERLGGEQRVRDRKKLVFAARPERGLDVLLRRIMPKLLACDPELRLCIAGYENDHEEWRHFYAQCASDAVALGDRVLRVGGLGKEDLYRLYLSSGVYVYPTPSPVLSNFREVSCISAMECQAAGLPIVTTATGALSETIAPGSGTLLSCDCSDAAYDAAFVDAAMRLIRDDSAWHAASLRGKEHAKQLDWSTIGSEWLCEFERLLRSANGSTERLIRHFWRMSDIVPAKHLLKSVQEDPTQQLSERQQTSLDALVAPWAFMEQPDGYRLQYERIGAGHSEDVYNAHEELRFTHLAEWLTQRRESIRCILDYGSAHGAYAVGLAQRLEHLRIHGVDIDRFSIDMATRAATRLQVGDRATFSVWTHDLPAAVAPGSALRFDCALVQEVLEHVPEPWAVLAAVEEQVAVGGKIYVTVPFGPWELASYRAFPHRCHIWHFDAHDLRDMLSAKADFELTAICAGDSPITGQAQGWWIASYTTDRRGVPKIDMERHLWLQRPRQTVSAALIAGAGAEENLHWTLRSLQDLVDEIVIADCGMGPEARRIAEQYGALLVPGVEPRRDGFDTARNAALEGCSCDWCFWIDTDEKLVGAELAERYLRENTFHSYAIRQHHFACDEAPTADYPLRLFRRRQHAGRRLRFWGAIHEHPEFALNAGAGRTIALRDVHIAHVGYLDEKTRRQRFLRNWPLLQLDQKRNPDRLIQKYFIMRDNMHLVRYSLTANGGLVDDEIQRRCRETVALYQKYFLGQDGLLNRQSIEYYSEALTVLGEGFETTVQVDADKEKASVGAVKRYRFASTHDFCVELNRTGAEKARQFDSSTW
jgi:glycosyltransferase involved in cell wall biosynthesis/2-polyprenyl-3-methyl-5-hydroxy-6-metoxy-1,4-benzoquinol methylase